MRPDAETDGRGDPGIADPRARATTAAGRTRGVLHVAIDIASRPRPPTACEPRGGGGDGVEENGRHQVLVVVIIRPREILSGYQLYCS